MTLLFIVLALVTYLALVSLLAWIVGFNELGNRNLRAKAKGMRMHKRRRIPSQMGIDGTGLA